jgi:hypothetical protein
MNNWSKFSLAAFAVISLVAGRAAARSGTNLQVKDITIIGTGDKARIWVPGAGGSTPSCGTSRPDHYAIDLASHKGKALHDLAMAAMLSGKPVHITGSATACFDVGGINHQQLDQLTLNP